MPLGETADCVARNAIGTSQEGQAMSAKLKAPKKKKAILYGHAISEFLTEIPIQLKT